jgi:hypothetical protein
MPRIMNKLAIDISSPCLTLLPFYSSLILLHRPHEGANLQAHFSLIACKNLSIKRGINEPIVRGARRKSRCSAGLDFL